MAYSSVKRSDSACIFDIRVNSWDGEARLVESSLSTIRHRNQVVFIFQIHNQRELILNRISKYLCNYRQFISDNPFCFSIMIQELILILQLNMDNFWRVLQTLNHLNCDSDCYIIVVLIKKPVMNRMPRVTMKRIKKINSKVWKVRNL